MKITYENQMNRDHDNAQSRFMERESEMKYECIQCIRQKDKLMYEYIFRYRRIMHKIVHI